MENTIAPIMASTHKPITAIVTMPLNELHRLRLKARSYRCGAWPRSLNELADLPITYMNRAEKNITTAAPR